MRIIAAIFVLSILPFSLEAQNYTAINGSSYIGSLNVHNNPATIVSSPLKWDIALFGIQDKHTTNAVKVFNYSLISNPVKSQYLISNGYFRRYASLNANLNLFNTRIALNKRNSIAFGANLRMNVALKTSPYNFIDTIGRFGDFFRQNEGTTAMNLDMASSSWAELYASYGRTVFDNDYSRLNAGITLKLDRGLSGAFANLADGSFIRNGNADPVQYRITNASLDFGYSSNYDRWDSTRNFKENTREFTSFTETGGSFDIGLEYLIKLQAIDNVLDDDHYFDYDWKIGLSLLDIGYGQYHLGRYSTRARNIKPEATDVLMDQVFDSTISNLGDLRDSLSNLFGNIGTYSGKYRINHPARLVLNVDKFIGESFFINSDISVNLSNLSTGANKRIKDMNVLTVTPRWETRKKGYCLPVYYNTHHQLWIGGAVRFGPILFGVHNWANIFSTKKSHRGGGYLVIILKAADFTTEKPDKRLACPW